MLLAAAIVGRSQPSVIEVEFPARPAGQEDVIGLTACCRRICRKRGCMDGNMPVAVPDFTRGGWNKIDGYRHAFAE